MTNKWTNADGLHVRFGTSEAEYAKQTIAAGLTRWLVAGFKVGQNISSTSSTQLAGGRLDAEHPVIIPKGSVLMRGYFIVDVAFDSGGSATLDLGLGVSAGTYSGGDEDGFVVGLTEASIDTAGKIVDLQTATTYKGVGYLADADGLYSVTGVDLYPTFDVDTIAFTVGEGRMLIEFMPPPPLGPNTYRATNAYSSDVT